MIREGRLSAALTMPAAPTPPGTQHNRGTLADLVADLHRPGEHVSISHKAPGGRFTTRVVPVEDAARVAGELPSTVDVWFGPNPVSPHALGRGTAQDVTRSAALWADLDVKPGGLPDLDTGQAIIADLGRMLPTRPSYIIHSGHGLQPVWPIDPDDDTANLDSDTKRRHAQTVLRRWGRLVAQVSADHGAGGVDSVYDLPRILRAPGSVNVKQPDRPVPVTCETPGGRPLTVAEVEDCLNTYGISELPEDHEQLGAVTAPPSTWAYGQHTCPWVAAMIRGWATDTPTARHPWLVGQAVRLAAAHRAGCITAADSHAAWDTLTARFRVLLTAPPARDEVPREVADAAGWATTKVATLSDERVAAELGNHQHGQPATTTSPLDPVDPERAHRGQLRMAYRLAASHVDRLLYVHGIGWHYWDGRRWAEDDRGTATRAVLDALREALAASLDDKQLRDDVRKCETAAGIAGVLNIAAALEPFAATVADLDTDPYLLNVANGTLDLRTLQLHPHNPADRITKVTRAAWHPEARSVEWEQFLVRVLPDEQVRSFLQRLAGLALLGKVVEHVFPIAIGPGANGKGTTYEAILHMLGDYGHVAPSDLFMATRSNPNAASPAQFGLRGRRLVVVSETERDHRLAMALMKNLTGGDPITARPLYGAPVTFPPAHTPLMVTNFLPKVAGDDPAAWRRIRVIPFDVVIPEEQQDEKLGERLQLAADAILTWAIAGWVDYRDHGMNPPPAVLRATDNYQRDSDTVSRFIDAECLVNPHMYAKVGDLWQRFERWRDDDGAQEISKRAFGEALDKRGFTVDRTHGGVRVRRGLGLQSTGEEEPDERW